MKSFSRDTSWLVIPVKRHKKFWESAIETATPVVQNREMERGGEVQLNARRKF